MTYVPGDVILVNDYSGQGDLIGNLIYDAEKCRHGAAHNTHSAIIVDEDGTLVEAMQQGVQRNPMHYRPDQVTLVHFDVPYPDPRRMFAVAFAEASVGEKYGAASWVGLFVQGLTGKNIMIHSNRTPICSELASRATECMTKDGWYFSPDEMEPDDIGVDMGLYAPGKPLPIYKRWLLLAQSIYWAIAPWKSGLKGRHEKGSDRPKAGSEGCRCSVEADSGSCGCSDCGSGCRCGGGCSSDGR